MKRKGSLAADDFENFCKGMPGCGRFALASMS